MLPTMELIVYYNIIPGRLASGPSYYSAGEPAEPAAIDVVTIKFRNNDEVSDWLYNVLVEYVYDKYESDMFEYAKEHHEDNPDYERI